VCSKAYCHGVASVLFRGITCVRLPASVKGEVTELQHPGQRERERQMRKGGKRVQRGRDSGIGIVKEEDTE